MYPGINISVRGCDCTSNVPECTNINMSMGIISFGSCSSCTHSIENSGSDRYIAISATTGSDQPPEKKPNKKSKTQQIRDQLRQLPGNRKAMRY